MKALGIFLGTVLITFLLLVSAQQTSAEVKIERLGTGPYGGECVEYARTLVPSLPHNLWTIEDKRKIINKHKPKKGRVAIIKINSGNYAKNGHVAVVTKVDDEGEKQSITLQESNYPPNMPGVQKRKVSGKKIKDIEKEIGIEGYYQP